MEQTLETLSKLELKMLNNAFVLNPDHPAMVWTHKEILAEIERRERVLIAKPRDLRHELIAQMDAYESLNTTPIEHLTYEQACNLDKQSTVHVFNIIELVKEAMRTNIYSTINDGVKERIVIILCTHIESCTE